MKTRMQAAITLAAIGLSTIAVSHNARACDFGNVQSPTNLHATMLTYTQDSPNVALTAAMRHEDGRGYANPLQKLEPITGLYRFTFTVQGNVADQGFVTWHADGTEIMNSGKAPQTQSFCMGAWTQTGPHTYRLNHWALNWDATGQTFLGPVNIRENITLAPGNNAYSGDFTLTQYTPDGKQPVGPTVHGTTTAMRVSANSN
ncbi:hypothetical protein PY254_13065 [Rhodanobacter sp. AS-Z3]|uniref:hypothetical protein n=1 Tax=Rhodanobacter sp. AS-Z3 TaxID=3031330 RepID=UPI002479B789|nr:hypothetical protein [Rhodanobacter sp. AS-Z3]WEN14163.1 hypothetical protein PY254_13065 [Rhodanobacter sp. AS-Z3]